MNMPEIKSQLSVARVIFLVYSFICMWVLLGILVVYCRMSCIIQGFLLYIFLTMPSLAYRRSTSACTSCTVDVLREIIKEKQWLKVNIACFKKMFLQLQYFLYIFCSAIHCYRSSGEWHFYLRYVTWVSQIMVSLASIRLIVVSKVG